MTISDKQSDNKPIKRPRGRPKGLRRVTRCTHGGFSENPLEVYEYWQRHKPEVAKFVDNTFYAFRHSLDWNPGHPLINELRVLAIMIASRNLMHGEMLKHDFKMAVRDPRTHSVVRFRAHHLIDPGMAFDARIHQKICDYGLLYNIKKNPRKFNIMDETPYANDSHQNYS